MLAQVLTAAAVGLAAQAALPAPQAPQAVPAPPTVADPLRGLDLWRGATVGMTQAEVRRRFPAATTPAKPAMLTGGEIGALQVGPFDLYGHPATARFFFAGPELTSVELSTRDLRPGRTQANIAAAAAIAQRYSAQYGAGYDCGVRSLADVNIYECKWLSGRLSIRLWYMDVAGQAPLFYVAYKQADNPSYNL